MPAARLYVLRNMPAVLQRPGWGFGLATTSTMNIVVPYMSIRSPGWSTPTLAASAQASIVPAARACRPVYPSVGPLPPIQYRRPRRPQQARKLEARSYLARPFLYPAVLLQVVERVALARRVVVEHILSCKTVNNEGACHEDVPRLLPYVRLVPAQP